MKSQGPLAHAQTPPRFVTGVDGLRSLAVIAVIIYHLLPNRMPGGFLGVPLFCDQSANEPLAARPRGALKAILPAPLQSALPAFSGDVDGHQRLYHPL